MKKPITIGQSHAVLLTLGVNVDWDALAGMSDVLQRIIKNPQEAGKQFTMFLRNGGKVIVGDPNIIKIDRSQPFDPVKFFGKGWNIQEQDGPSLSLTGLNLTRVRLEHMLKENETSITGEEKLRRLKEAACIRLDAKIFQTLWENQELIPSSWEQAEGLIYFDGTVFRDPDGHRYVLQLYMRYGRWVWDLRKLKHNWVKRDLSAVLFPQFS